MDENATSAQLRGDLNYLFDKASQVLTSRTSAALAQIGVSTRDYCVLSKAASGSLTQSELAAAALLDKTTMVVTLDHLEAAGLARRTPSSTDRRVRIVETTADGDRIVDEGRRIIDGVYDDVLGVLPDASRSAFLDAMVLLVEPGGPLSASATTGAVQRRRSVRSA